MIDHYGSCSGFFFKEKNMKRPVAMLTVPAQYNYPEMKFKLYPGLNKIGRQKGDVELKHDFVSSNHANIGTLLLLHASNTTFRDIRGRS